VLSVGELWADRDALRVALLGDGILEPGTEYALAVIPSTANLIDPHRWYAMPSAMSGATPLRIVVVAVDADHYATLERRGCAGLNRRRHARRRLRTRFAPASARLDPRA
jgi:hypothetical protein